ncbi:MAG: hypothetical protein sL5_02540 [Candidatus Mesenet longicola]|uniref:Uncharacterized protein n=1 Tax=Candidatus Mesenet longicola TaxID=1892558 RepID=A0A8J3HVX4_9RICK|nr:MAG: hypothetical protein sGL2_02480 [Candidatus Mesenet longicola]GHM59261.1 MAG: hypothetical protein sL5_02540 [Candidatus Mesenet longicola]
MSNIEFIDVAVDTYNMVTIAPMGCNSIGVADQRVIIGYKDQTLEITEYDDRTSDNNIKVQAKFDDVNLKYYKEEPGVTDTIGLIFSHVDKDQFEQLRNSLSNSDMFTTIGVEKDNEHIDLTNIDYNQFNSCS